MLQACPWDDRGMDGSAHSLAADFRVWLSDATCLSCRPSAGGRVELFSARTHTQQTLARGIPDTSACAAPHARRRGGDVHIWIAMLHARLPDLIVHVVLARW